MGAPLAVVSLITTVVGAGVQYTAQRRAAKAQEAAAEYNAEQARKQAAHESDVAGQNAIRQSEQKRRRLASLRARAAGSGVSFTGSVVDHSEGAAFQLERDIQTDAYQSQVRQATLHNQANMTSWEGKQQAAATRMNANAGLLSNAGKIGGQLYGGFDLGTFQTR